MQKGMLSPWLMRVYLGTAIALPSSALVGLTLPAEAATGADKTPVKETLSASLSSGAHVTHEISPNLSQPSAAPVLADSASQALAAATPRPAAWVADQLTFAPQFSPLEKPVPTKPESSTGGIALVSEVPAAVAATFEQSELLLSQAEAESVGEEAEAPADESIDNPAEEAEEADEVFSPLPDSDAEAAVEEAQLRLPRL